MSMKEKSVSDVPGKVTCFLSGGFFEKKAPTVRG